MGILLKDKQGVKISNVVMGALFGSDCNVLRGELVIRIPEKPHKEGQPPHNYQTVYTDQPATFYDETNISPLLGNQPLLLAAVKSNEERYQLFVSGKMDWGSTLKINDPVQVSLKHPQPSDTAATLKATAVIHYVGPVTGVNGIMFGIEIVVSVSEEHRSGCLHQCNHVFRTHTSLDRELLMVHSREVATSYARMVMGCLFH